MRKEQKLAQQNQHFKVHVRNGCVSKFQTDCSHMQTCPEELRKTCLSIPPQTHHIPVARTHGWLTGGCPHPALPSHQDSYRRTCSLRKHKAGLMGFCIPAFTKVSQDTCRDAYFIHFGANKNVSIFDRSATDSAVLQIIYFKRNRHTFLPLKQQLSHMVTPSQSPLMLKKTMRYEILQGRKLHS